MAPVDESSGVYKKVVGQTKAIRDLGHIINTLFIRDSSYCFLDNGESLQKYDIETSFKTIISQTLQQSDICYFRFELLRHKYYRKCWLFCLKNKIKYILEIPTYPPVEESKARAKASIQRHEWLRGLKTWIGSLFVVLDMYLLANMAKLVCVVADDKKFKYTHTIRIENGINISDIPFDPCDETKTNKIRIITVSNFSIWNGYDRAIEGLKYLSKDNKNRVQLVFVGDKNNAADLIELSNKYNVQNNVLFTGSLKGNDLTNEYRKADIALGALGNHRRKVFANSSLKAKEYAAYGKLMVLSDTEGIESVIKENSHIVPSDESPLDYNGIIKWFDDINDKKTRRAINRQFAEKHYSWEKQMEIVLKSI